MKKIPPIAWILLIGLLLRMISLNQSLWLDEGIQWWAVTTFPFKHLITEYIKGDFNPPLYHAIMFFWVRLFGDSEMSLRLPSVLFGLGTIYFTYKIAQVIFAEEKFRISNLEFRISEIAAIFSATGPLLVYYSQEARMYSLAVFAITSCLYFLLKSKTSPRPLFLILYSLFLILALYSHYLTWLLIPVLVIVQPLFTAMAMLAFAPFLPTFLSQLQQGLDTASVNPIWGEVVGGFSLKNIALLPIKFLIGRLPVDATPIYIIPLGLLLLLVGYLLYKSFRVLRNTPYAILFAWFFAPLILGMIVSLKIPIFSYFRFLYLVPIFYLLIVHGISQLKPKHQEILVIFFLSLNLLATSYYLLATNIHREDWKSATQYIHLTDNQAPVIIYAPVQPPFDYYNRDQSPVFTEKQLDQLIGRSDVWFITYAQPIFDPEEKTRITLEELGFQEIFKRHFRGVTVIRYKNFNAKLYSFVPR